MTCAFGLWWSDWHSRNPPPQWVLVPSRKNGEAIEIEGDDIKKYNTMDYWLAIRFWKDYKKFGLKKDWRELTPQQKNLIILYDDLAEARTKNARN